MGTIVDTRNGYLSVRFYQPHSKRILFCSFCLSGNNTPCLLHRTVGVPFHPQSSSPLLRLCDYCIRTLGSHTYEFSTLKRSSSSVLFHPLMITRNPPIVCPFKAIGWFSGRCNDSVALSSVDPTCSLMKVPFLLPSVLLPFGMLLLCCWWTTIASYTRWQNWTTILPSTTTTSAPSCFHYLLLSVWCMRALFVSLVFVQTKWI